MDFRCEKRHQFAVDANSGASKEYCKMKTHSLGWLAGVVFGALAATTAAALPIDFESGYSGRVNSFAGDEFAANGLHFSSTDAMRVVEMGAPTDGFVGEAYSKDLAPLGNYFLTGDFNGTSDLKVSFDYDVTSVSFDLADIDTNEVFTITAYDQSDNALQTIVLRDDGLGDAGYVTGNAKLTDVLLNPGQAFRWFFVDIRTITSKYRDIGFGFDNLDFTIAATDATGSVPLPGGLVLGLSAFGGLALTRLRRRKA